MAHIGNVLVAAMRHASSNLALSSSNACLAQLAERRLDKADVVRSIRTTGTTDWPFSSPGRASVSKSEGRWFETIKGRQKMEGCRRGQTALFRKQMVIAIWRERSTRSPSARSISL